MEDPTAPFHWRYSVHTRARSLGDQEPSLRSLIQSAGVLMPRGCGLVHLDRAGAESVAEVVELDVRVIGQEGHGH